MIKFVYVDLWDQVGQLASRSRRKMAAIAYVTTATPVSFGEGDILVVDASDKAITSGQTSAAILVAAHKRRAKIYSCPNLHAKVFLFDQIAVVGSANLSNSSQKTLIEAAVISDQPSVVSQARHLIDQLRTKAILLDDTTLSRLSSLKVERNNQKLPPRPDLISTPHQSWLVSVHEIDPDRYIHEAQEVERGEKRAMEKLSDDESQVEWIRYFPSNRMKFVRDGREGDSVIQIWTDPKNESKILVYPPQPILERVVETQATRFFIEKFASTDKRALSWKVFCEKLTAAGLSQSVKPTTTRLIPEPVIEALHSLWDE